MEGYSLIGPDVYMNPRGQLFKKASDQFVPVKDKYTEAEDRFVEKHANRREGNQYETRFD
jgi:hypothetical protein